MSKRLKSLFSAALMLSATGVAHAGEVEAWTPTLTDLRAASAGIIMPQSVGGLSLSKSGEVSNGGKGIDNYAQYLSEDGAIQATLYIYMPSYADASIAAYMTDKAIMTRFGSKTHRTAYASTAAGGHSGAAIRAVYDDAAEGALTTAAAFVHAGRWLVKLRVTGPSAQRKAVLAGLDGMLGAMQFDNASALHSVAPVQLTACGPRDATDSLPIAPVEAGLSRDGRDPMCVSGRIDTAEGSYEMLQQANLSHGTMIVPMDDAGTVLAFDPTKDRTGYQLSIHSVGQTDLYGVYPQVPTAQQIAAIIEGKDPQTARAGKIADYAANGEMTIRTGAR